MSIELAAPIEGLVNALKRLPGLGPRSAQRVAFYLLQNNNAALLGLLDALETARQSVRRCERCHTLSDSSVCPVCADEQRNRTMLCVVESVADQMALDASLSWPGLYFVLSGRLNPIEGQGPNEIGMDHLLGDLPRRVEADHLDEVVIATSYTPEGDATAYYLIEKIREKCPSIHVTRLARGLPTGIEIEYTDLNTIANAVFSRKDV